MKIPIEELDDLLARFALTDSQRKVYQYLFKVQKASIKDIAAATSLNRTTVYSIVEQLASDELVHKESPNFGAKIVFSHPAKLMSFAEQRAQQFQDSTKQLAGLLPELLANYKQLSSQTRVSQYEGIKGVEQMYNDVLLTFEHQPALKRDSLIGCTNLGKVIANLPVRWANSARRKQSDLKVTSRYFIQPDDDGERYVNDKYLAYGLKYYPRFKKLPKDLFDIDTEISIYANKVSFISLKEEEPVAVIIESNVFSNSLRALFETLWALI